MLCEHRFEQERFVKNKLPLFSYCDEIGEISSSISRTSRKPSSDNILRVVSESQNIARLTFQNSADFFQRIKMYRFSFASFEHRKILRCDAGLLRLQFVRNHFRLLQDRLGRQQLHIRRVAELT